MTLYAGTFLCFRPWGTSMERGIPFCNCNAFWLFVSASVSFGHGVGAFLYSLGRDCFDIGYACDSTVTYCCFPSCVVVVKFDELITFLMFHCSLCVCV